MTNLEREQEAQIATLTAKLEEVRKENLELGKELVSAIIESRNNYCPCCHCRLDEICGPCKWCKDKDNHLDTERSMYRAWRKRAEQSERELTSLQNKLKMAEVAISHVIKNYGTGDGWVSIEAIDECRQVLAAIKSEEGV